MNNSKNKYVRVFLLKYLRELLSQRPADVATLTKLYAVCSGTTEKHVRSQKLSIAQLKSKAEEVFDFPLEKLMTIKIKLFNIRTYGIKRSNLLISLQNWENEINSQNLGVSTHISVENNVDLEYPPTDFKFIEDYINETNISFLYEAVTYCHCKNNCLKNKNSCCPSNSEASFAYNRYKRLILHPGSPIYECNNNCTCNKTCINRVVQHGPKIKMSIFRTEDKGWGLKTLESIEKGQFVVEYMGEIITSDTAEKRYGSDYLFDLDFDEGNESCFSIDARHVGNVAHFINHSCEPNLHVFAVWINQQDPRLPRLAFFAQRKIFKGEELTFDYQMSKDGPDKSNRIRCKCRSKKCRKYLF